MLCEKCGIREANIRYTEIVNGVKTEHNFCSQCAREMDLGQYSAILDGEFPLGKLLSGLLGIADYEESDQERVSVMCPTCHTTFEDFVENSRFGCPDCYGVFDLFISDKIKQLQGSSSHKGKRPKYQSPQERQRQQEMETDLAAMDGGASCEADPAAKARKELDQLGIRLKEALKAEDYELAAVCRDQMRALREEVKRHDEVV